MSASLAVLKSIPQFFTRAKPVVEPLDAAEAVEKKLERFPEELYTHSRNSHLFRYLLALCGEAGAGALKKELLYVRLQQMLESTSYGDIDKFFGNPLHLPRISEEIYLVNPHNESLTQEQWQSVKVRDGLYRSRCLTWMRAIIHGPSLTGISLAAEAATGIECDVFERNKYLENQTSDDPINVQDIGETGMSQEFVIIPRTHSITQEERRRIIHLVDHLRPTNSVPTVYDGTEIRTERPIMDLESSTDGWNVLRMVKGREDVDWPEPDPTAGYWLEQDVENEAPTFAWINNQETATYLTIVETTASSFHTGPYNKVQRDLFSHLKNTPELYFEYHPNHAYARNFAPISFNVPYFRRD